MNDIDYMKLALKLAQKGRGWVNPNPMVGAVVVKNNRIIGKGYHHKIGDLHAERDALKNLTESAKGADMYVTLEPCCHHGKQPPCTDAIIEAGIKRVITGSGDPNPLVAGNGIEILRQNGIEVTEHILEAECNRLNEVFMHYIQHKTPFVTMKYAMTLDGKIATYSGKSKWITGEESRKNVHRDRHNYSAIMVGVGTVLADNPMLNCRLENSKNPIRIICDTSLRTPLESNIVNSAKEIKTIVATSSTDKKLIEKFISKGCTVLEIPKKNSHTDLNALMTELGRLEIDSILLEGGATLNWSALENGIVNKVQAYIAPKIFGGKDSKSAVEGQGFEAPDICARLVNTTVHHFGDDIMIEGEVARCSQE